MKKINEKRAQLGLSLQGLKELFERKHPKISVSRITVHNFLKSTKEATRQKTTQKITVQRMMEALEIPQGLQENTLIEKDFEWKIYRTFLLDLKSAVISHDPEASPHFSDLSPSELISLALDHGINRCDAELEVIKTSHAITYDLLHRARKNSPTPIPNVQITPRMLTHLLEFLKRAKPSKTSALKTRDKYESCIRFIVQSKQEAALINQKEAEDILTDALGIEKLAIVEKSPEPNSRSNLFHFQRDLVCDHQRNAISIQKSKGMKRFPSAKEIMDHQKPK